jgi:hypothetical protein
MLSLSKHPARVIERLILVHHARCFDKRPLAEQDILFSITTWLSCAKNRDPWRC